MKIKETEAIKAAELLKQFCEERGCTDCIFSSFGNCILTVSDYYEQYEYVPHNWDLDLIEED